MKKHIFLVLLTISFYASGQVLEVPTLKSKGINGAVKTIEWLTFQAVQDKGEIKAKKDIETYDEKGRLVSVITENYQNNQTYKTVYTLDKKGLLTKTEIINPSNNLSLRTTDYEYKKGLLVKTTQSQGTNSVVKDYTYNQSKQLIQVDVFQNGTLSLTEYYELDAQDRRTKISRKLPADTEVKVTSTFTYQLEGEVLISTEKRSTDQGEFTITKKTIAANKRDQSETTKRMSDGMQATNEQFFEDDENGNWVKGEVIGDQYSRSRLVLRKLTYSDGSESGRTEMKFPNDYHAQFVRQYSQKRVAINGKVHSSTVAYNLDYTDDRLTYVHDYNAWVLLNDYDKNSNMTKWAKAEVISGGRDKVIWSASSEGIDVFNAGRQYQKGTTTYTYRSYEIGGSIAAYIRGEVNKSFVVEKPADRAGKVYEAELTSDHFQWGKLSDSTYVLANRGRSIGLQYQIEDKEGNKLASLKQGGGYFWYYMPGFREKFDSSELGKIYKAEQVYDPSKFVKEGKLKTDFSSFTYDKLANSRYRLKSKDGLSVTKIAAKSIKTPDDQLFVYFPFTQQYLLMEDFYQLENGKEWNDQRVSVISDSTSYLYFMYNDNKSINFYTPEGRIQKRAFANHKIDPNLKKYVAVVYDSANNVSYGMNYDLDGEGGFGPMRKLIANPRGTYILKLNDDRWVIVEKGIKIQDYAFSKLSENGSVVHFFKDEKGKTKALEFRGFDAAEPGDIKYATVALKEDFELYMKEFGIDPDLKKSEASAIPKGKPLTFERDGRMLFARNQEGEEIAGNFSWFVTNGTGNDLIAYDSVGKTTYRVREFYSNENIAEGKVEILVKPTDTKALKWSKSSINIVLDGEFQRDINRSFITQNAADEIYSEVFYDQSEGESYQVSYPSDSNFHVIDLSPIPKSHNNAYLFRINEKKFLMIEKGNLIKNQAIRSRELGQDLIRMIPEGDGVKGYLFKGYQSAKIQKLIPAQPMTEAELETAWAAAGEQLKAKANTGKSKVVVPNDKWMTAINGCGSNAECIANYIDQMGTAIKNGGFNKEEMNKALVPYLVGVGNKNKDALYEVFMKMKADYVGTMTHPSFPKELKEYVRSKSMKTVQDYEKKYGSPKIKTVTYKGKGGGN